MAVALGGGATAVVAAPVAVGSVLAELPNPVKAAHADDMVDAAAAAAMGLAGG